MLFFSHQGWYKGWYTRPGTKGSPPGIAGGVIHERISSVESVFEENKCHTKVCNSLIFNYCTQKTKVFHKSEWITTLTIYLFLCFFVRLKYAWPTIGPSITDSMHAIDYFFFSIQRSIK